MMSVRSNAELFRRIPLFAECDDTHLQLLAFASERMRFRSDEPIVSAGTSGRAGYLIVSGAADVWLEEGNERKAIAALGPGAFIGEMAMIAGRPYPANVTATAEVMAMRVSRDVFMRVVAEFPEFGIRVHRELAKRLDLSLAELNRVRRLFEETP
jgi:CRP-like cAMP-binding protein